MTHAELDQLLLYQESVGTFSVVKKLDRGFALLAHLLCLAHGIKIQNKIPSVDDFMYRKPVPAEVCTDVNQAFAFLKSVKKNGN